MAADVTSSSSSTHPLYLDPSQRPRSIQSALDIYQRDVESCTSTAETPDYETLGIKTYELVLRQILDQPLQKEFNVIAIGTGEVQWGSGLALWIQENIGKTEAAGRELMVNIINIRGEKHERTEAVLGVCKIHNIGSFKIEEINTELNKCGFKLDNAVDFAISRKHFLHFVDPLGTLIQTLNLLRPGSGCAVLGGFSFLIEGTSKDKFNPNTQMLQVLSETNVAFLRVLSKCSKELNDFILRRKDVSVCQLSMQYVGCSRVSSSSMIGSKMVTRFSRETPLPLVHFPIMQGVSQSGRSSPCQQSHVYGDGALYVWLKKSALFHQERQRWLPIEFKPHGEESFATQSGVSHEEERVSVARAVWESELQTLSQPEKNTLHFHIWDLAGRPAEPGYGERHALDDLAIFRKAIGAADLRAKFTSLT